jgi:hypothetical protein
MGFDLKNNFSTDCAKKIFGNSANALQFLLVVANEKGLQLPIRKVTRGKNVGDIIWTDTTDNLWASVVRNWNYETGLRIVRKLFTETKKYASGKDSYETMQVLLEEWTRLKLGSVAWPFSQGQFDNFVQALNAQTITRDEKDDKVRIAAVKYRRIKEINTVRNDFIETLIFESNDNILPTLNHRRSVDFFVDGISFDQKVAASPTKEFQKTFGENWKEYAIDHPATVAEYLYRYQDEGRFGSDSRLLVVYLDEDVSITRIADIITATNLQEPLEVDFEYDHERDGAKVYKVKCFVILLHNA